MSNKLKTISDLFNKVMKVILLIILCSEYANANELVLECRRNTSAYSYQDQFSFELDRPSHVSSLPADILVIEFVSSTRAVLFSKSNPAWKASSQALNEVTESANSYIFRNIYRNETLPEAQISIDRSTGKLIENDIIWTDKIATGRIKGVGLCERITLEKKF